MSVQDPIKVESKPGETKVLTTPTGVRGVEIYQFPWIQDPRGDLTVGEFESEFPFRPKRYFIVSGVPSGEIRGEHAHRRCQQFLICAYGQCSVTVDDGATRLEILLNKPNVGIYLPPMVWADNGNTAPTPHCSYSLRNFMIQTTIFVITTFF